jgi:hypothetical protein
MIPNQTLDPVSIPPLRPIRNEYEKRAYEKMSTLSGKGNSVVNALDINSAYALSYRLKIKQKFYGIRFVTFNVHFKCF